MKPGKKDFYKILGVTPLEKESEVKKSYKELTKKYHPDLNPHARTWAEEKMRELSEAYEVIMDSEKRKEYDNNPLFNLKVPRFIDPQTKALKAGPYRQEKTSGLLDKLKKLIFVQEEEPLKTELSRKGAEHFALGLSYLDKKTQKMLEMAKYEFESVLKDAPDNPEGLYDMGVIEYRLGNYERALKLFSKARRRMEDGSDARMMIDLLRDE